MAKVRPFQKPVNDKYTRNLWGRAEYYLLHELFYGAQFDETVLPVAGQTLIEYRYAGGTASETDEEPASDWRLPGGGGSGSQYDSYFRVINASTAEAVQIGVTNGSAAMLDPVGICGTVKVNGVRVDVTAIAEAITAAGVYYVWIHSWLSAVDGEQAEMIVGAVGVATPPDNPNGGLLYASQLAGRVTAEMVDGELAIVGIVQDYKHGGEHQEYLHGDCDSATITLPECPA